MNIRKFSKPNTKESFANGKNIGQGLDADFMYT